MADETILARIATWEAAGLIDTSTAGRLRAAESARPATAGEIEDATPASPQGTGAPTVLATGTAQTSVRGADAPVATVRTASPASMLVEVFAYLGSLFILGAWYALIERLARDRLDGDPDPIRLVGATAAAVVLSGIGAFWWRETGSRGRASSTAFLVSGWNVAGAVFILLTILGLADGDDLTAKAVLAAAGGLAAAAAYRWLRVALGTQVGVLLAVVATASGGFLWAQDIFFAVDGGLSNGGQVDDATGYLKVALTLAYWLAFAVGLGWLGLMEARSGSPGAASRAAATRVVAGLLAVLGTALAVVTSGSFGERLVPPAIGDALVLLVSAVLLERAFRRRATAFIVPGALGVFIALTDLNSNVSGRVGSEVFLLIEGVLLLVVAGAAEVLRRRVVAEPAPA
jgi:hypothetical protein